MIEASWRAYPGIGIGTYQTLPEHLRLTARHHMLKAKHFMAIGAYDIAFDRMSRAAHNSRLAKRWDEIEA